MSQRSLRVEMGSTVRRLVLLTALLALYPLAMVLFHFAGDAGGEREQPSALSLQAEWAADAGALRVSLDVRNDSLAGLAARELLLNLIRDGEPDTALILSGQALGAPDPIPPGGGSHLGPFLLPLTKGPGGDELLLQASLTVTETERERRFELREEVVLEPLSGE